MGGRRNKSKGKFIYRGGCDTYEGQIKDGMKWGYIKYIYNFGEIFEGQYVKNIIHGRGKLIKVSGDIYEGQWKDNKPEGKGIHRYNNKDVYEGWWCNGEWTRGKMTYGHRFFMKVNGKIDFPRDKEK